MVLYFDEGLRNGFSLRVSRFPDRNATWVWCHVVQDGVVYAFTEPRLTCAPDRIGADQTDAIYDAPGMDVSIRRAGTSQALAGMSFRANVQAHRGEGGVDGPGIVAVSLEGTFRPGNLRSGSPGGRFERTGIVDARVEVEGRSVQLKGVAKAHEQTQTRPRFFGAFTYAMLWGPTASLIGLMAKGLQFGNYEAAGEDRPVSAFRIERWAPERAFVAQLDNGERIAGRAITHHKYRIPVFSRMWHGHVVEAEIAGHRMVGMINDWRSEDQPYGLG